MTDKEFVKSVYPLAKCFMVREMLSTHPNSRFDYAVAEVYDYAKKSGYGVGWGSSPKKAWQDAAQYLRNKMLRKLES